VGACRVPRHAVGVLRMGQHPRRATSSTVEPTALAGGDDHGGEARLVRERDGGGPEEMWGERICCAGGAAELAFSSHPLAASELFRARGGR
jgi:hypothetical protein